MKHRDDFRAVVQPRRHQHKFAVIGPSEKFPGMWMEKCVEPGCQKRRIAEKS